MLVGPAWAVLAGGKGGGGGEGTTIQEASRSSSRHSEAVMSRRSTLAAALALPFLSCSNPDGLSPTGTGALALRILPTSGVRFPSGRVILTVTKDTTVDATPGQPVTISNLPAGPYMVGLEGFVGDSVSGFQQLTVTIVAGQTARPMIALQPFGTVIDSMPTYTTSGQTFTVLFEKVAVATSYVVQKDSFATFVTSHDTTVLATSAQIAIPPTGPYFVRVAAVDAYGKRGTPSAARPITTLITCCRSEEHTSELQSQSNIVCRLLLEKKKGKHQMI